MKALIQWHEEHEYESSVEFDDAEFLAWANEGYGLAVVSIEEIREEDLPGLVKDFLKAGRESFVNLVDDRTGDWVQRDGETLDAVVQVTRR